MAEDPVACIATVVVLWVPANPFLLLEQPHEVHGSLAVPGQEEGPRKAGTLQGNQSFGFPTAKSTEKV